MPLVLNCASTCANHTVGSVGQNGGSLMLMAATVAGVATAGVAASLVGAVSSVASAEVDMVGAVCGSGEMAECSESRGGHQCSVATNTRLRATTLNNRH